MESLQTYYYLIAEIRIVVKVLQNVKQVAAKTIILFIKPFFKYLHLYLYKYGQVVHRYGQVFF